MTRWRTRLRGSRAERGAAAVEFAIVLTVLLLILLGIIDFGRLLFVSQAVKSASREGARVAAVRAAWGPAATAGTVQKTAADAGAAAAALSGGGALSITTNRTVSGPGDTSALCPTPAVSTTAPVDVTVTATFRWLTPIGALPGLSAPGLTGTKPVASTTTMRCE